MERKLAAILAADVVGYSRLMEQDEAATFQRLRSHRKELFEPEIEKHHGRIFKLMGDGLLAEFGSVVDAVECAVSLQRGMAERNAAVDDERRIDVRIGINLGEVIVEGEDRYGEGVNIAARLQELAEPGGICVSGKVSKEVEKKLAFGFEPIGDQQVKNIAEPVPVYRIAFDGQPPRLRRPGRSRRTEFRRSWMVLGAVLLVGLGALVAGQIYLRSPEPASTSPSPEAAIGIPVILVLPFQNLTGDPAQDKLGVGITEDLRDLLWHFPEFQVVSGTSSVGAGGSPPSLTEVAKTFGAQFVIEGTVRRSGDKTVITAQLIDGRTDVHLWSTRFEERISDPVALEDAAAQKLLESLGGMTGTMRKSYERIAWSKPEAALTPYDYYVRGHGHQLHFDLEHAKLAKDIYMDGLKRFSTSALLRIKLAFAHLQAMYLGSDKPAEEAKQFRDLVTEATTLLSAGGGSRFEEFYLHWVSAYAGEYDQAYDRCIAEAEAAVAMSPYDPFLLGDLAGPVSECGKPDEGIAWATDAAHREPGGLPAQLEFYKRALVWAGYLADRCPAAVAIMEGLESKPLEILAACYVRLGQFDPARHTMADFAKDNAGWTMTSEHAVPIQMRPGLRNRWFADIRAAGLPEK
jgi:adenylate cyclase